MEMTAPAVDERAEQPYMGIRTRVAMDQLGQGIIPQLLDEVFGWLARHDLSPAGEPFIRYHVIDMARQLDIELGVPVATAPAGDERVRPGTLPAGRYASLIYTGVENGIAGNKALLDWGREQGLVWDTYESKGGDGFGSRYETFLSNPDDEPDPAKWQTEVAIRLA